MNMHESHVVARERGGGPNFTHYRTRGLIVDQLKPDNNFIIIQLLV